MSDGRSAALWSKARTRSIIWQFGTIDSDMSGFATVKTKVVVDVELALFQSESSMTIASSASVSASLSSVLSERRGSWHSIDLGFFFQDFSNVWVLTSEASSRASKGAPIPIEFSGFLNKSSQCIWHQRYLKQFVVKSSIQSSAECVHFGSVIHVGSSSIFALFLVPFTEFPVSLWSIMYILDRFILRFQRDELVLEGIFKGLPHSISNRVCCECNSNAIASPISSLGPLFKVG